jgi:hypothetical protein
LIGEDIYYGSLGSKPNTIFNDIVFGQSNFLGQINNQINLKFTQLKILKIASYYEKFSFTIYGYDFNVEGIKKNSSIFIKERKGVSIDECCRLCLTEPSFSCQSLSYEPISRICKWSSISEADRRNDGAETAYFEFREFYSYYISKLRLIKFVA